MTDKTDSLTPETDAAEQPTDRIEGSYMVVRSDFARSLERKLYATRLRLAATQHIRDLAIEGSRRQMVRAEALEDKLAAKSRPYDYLNFSGENDDEEI